MSKRASEEEKEVSQPKRKRSPRVPVNFAVNIEGRTAKGELFNVQGEAERVSRSGATIIADVEVAKGAQVYLTPPFGKVLEAEVNGVWVDEQDKRQRIGIKFLTDDGWFAE
jgi:hypothetical protein